MFTLTSYTKRCKVSNVKLVSEIAQNNNKSIVQLMKSIENTLTFAQLNVTFYL